MLVNGALEVKHFICTHAFVYYTHLVTYIIYAISLHHKKPCDLAIAGSELQRYATGSRIRFLTSGPPHDGLYGEGNFEKPMVADVAIKH